MENKARPDWGVFAAIIVKLNELHRAEVQTLRGQMLATSERLLELLLYEMCDTDHFEIFTGSQVLPDPEAVIRRLQEQRVSTSWLKAGRRKMWATQPEVPSLKWLAFDQRFRNCLSPARSSPART